MSDRPPSPMLPSLLAVKYATKKARQAPPATTKKAKTTAKKTDKKKAKTTAKKPV